MINNKMDQTKTRIFLHNAYLEVVDVGDTTVIVNPCVGDEKQSLFIGEIDAYHGVCEDKIKRGTF